MSNPNSLPETVDLPLLPLRDVVVFPHMVIPLFVGREKSIRALDMAMEADKRILLVAQKSAETDDPSADDLYQVGTVAQVLIKGYQLGDSVLRHAMVKVIVG